MNISLLQQNVRIIARNVAKTKHRSLTSTELGTPFTELWKKSVKLLHKSGGSLVFSIVWNNSFLYISSSSLGTRDAHAACNLSLFTFTLVSIITAMDAPCCFLSISPEPEASVIPISKFIQPGYRKLTLCSPFDIHSFSKVVLFKSSSRERELTHTVILSNRQIRNMLATEVENKMSIKPDKSQKVLFKKGKRRMYLRKMEWIPSRTV